MTKAVTSESSSPFEPGCILLATSSERPPRASLLQARELAEVTGAELQLLRVLSERRLSSALGSESVLARFIEAAITTSHHCRDVLGDSYDDDRLAIAIGSLRDGAATRAEELAAGLVVVPAGELPGHEVTSLAQTTELPVLVLRPEQRDASSILVATDLTRPDYPVLRSARALAVLRGARIVALHAARKQRLAAALGAQLQGASSALGLDGSVLLPAPDTVGAILGEASRREVDLIVVGTHARPPLARVVRRSVAARLIDRARRSVWVQPLVAESHRRS
jgi:nucleotide-binding universal stress UspA family protein